MLESFERLKKIREQAGVSPQELADITHVSLASQYNYEKGTRKPDIDYLTRLHEAGFDAVYLITGNRSAEILTEEEKNLLEVWYRADPVLREAAWRVLTTGGSSGGDPEAFFKAHRDKTNKKDTGALFLGSALLYLPALVFASAGAAVEKSGIFSAGATWLFVLAVLGLATVSLVLVGYTMGVSIRNSWLLMPVYRWCRYNLFDQLWRKWKGDVDGEGRKAAAKIALWHAYNSRETAKERFHENPTKRRKAKMARLEALWQSRYRTFIAEYGMCAPVV